MSDLSKRLAALSPEKRKLLAQALQQQTGAADTFPLSFAQRRLWFLDRWRPGNPVYHLPAVLRMEGALDVAALERSLQTIVQRHEILHTTFVTIADQPVQLIQPYHALPVQVVDLGDSRRMSGNPRPRAWPVPRRGARSIWPPPRRCG